MTTIHPSPDPFDSLLAEIGAAVSADSPPTAEMISRFEGLVTDLACDQINRPVLGPKWLEETRRTVARSLYELMSPPTKTDRQHLRELIGELFPRAEQADVLSDSAIFHLLARARAINEAKRELAIEEAKHRQSAQELARTAEELEGRECAILYRVIMQRDYIDLENRCAALTADCAELRKKLSEIAALVSQFRYALDYTIKSFSDAEAEAGMELLRSLMGYLTQAPGMPTAYHAIYEDTRTTRERMRALVKGGKTLSCAQLLYEICSAWHRSMPLGDRHGLLKRVVLDIVDRLLIGTDETVGLDALIGSPAIPGRRPRVSFRDWSRWVGKEHPPGGPPKW